MFRHLENAVNILFFSDRERVKHQITFNLDSWITKDEMLLFLNMLLQLEKTKNLAHLQTTKERPLPSMMKP